MTELEKILKKKNAVIDKAQKEISKFFADNSEKFANDIARIVGRGIYDVKSIQEILTAFGYDEVIIKALSKFDIIFNYSKTMAKYGKWHWLWTAENEAAFAEFLKVKADKIINNFKTKIAYDISDFAISTKLSQMPSAQIKQELGFKFAMEGRNIMTEVNTAMATFDRTAKDMLYKNAGIEKYIYVGPNDNVTRESCRKILASPLQETGWTRAQIDANPDVDFNLGGKPYYNCRHEFVPFMG